MAESSQNTVVSVDRVIKAPAAVLFAVVADATRHPEIDGSGQLVKAKDGASHQLTMGSTFDMSMKMGVPYSMSNTVVEFEQDRRIAWRTVQAGFLGRFLGGRIWRYEFEPVDGATRVTESWDISTDKQAIFLKHHKIGQQTAAAMSRTLDRLAEITES
jgi:polyketide cyclase/dehydrase/lipid transport protein